VLSKVLMLAVVVGTVVLTGCKDAADDKQPKLQGPPDPKIKGPAQPGGAKPGDAKPGDAKL